MLKLLITIFILTSFIIYSKELSLKDKNEVFKKADDIMLKISKYGERKPNLTVKKSLTSKKDVIKYLDSEIKAQYSENQFLAEEQIMKLFGLINKDVNYLKAIKYVLSQEVAGYYNPKNNTMYIADWIPIALQEIVLAHELFHAVQKENYKVMDKIMNSDNSNSDEKLAISSLLEGEATAIMMDYEMVIKKKSNMSFEKVPMLEFMLNMSMAMSPSKSFNKYSKYPQVMMAMMVFPYIKGLVFLTHFKKAGGWKAIDKIYKRLPISTEQILHIDKYISNEKPIKIKLKNKETLIKNCKYLGESVLGEASLYTIFQHDKLNETNISDADGWNGDKIYVYDCNKTYSAIFITQWDTVKDASEFLSSIAKFLNDSVGKNSQIKLKSNSFKISLKNNKQYYGLANNKRVIVLLNLNNSLIKPILSKF